jgi:hypothetical protein
LSRDAKENNGAPSLVLSHIKSRQACHADVLAVNISWRNVTSNNVGGVDQYVRIVVGLALVAFAFENGPFIQGWQAGLVVPVTAFFRSCHQQKAMREIMPT